MVHMCKIIISFGVFFISKFWFSGWSKVKGQKMTQNDKKFGLLHLICQERYIKWLWSLFMAHFFFFFYSFDFLDCYGEVKGHKIAQNNKKSCFSHSVSQEPYIIWLWFLVHLCKMILSPVFFFLFFNILIFRCFRE